MLEQFLGKYEESCRPDQRGNSKIRIVRKRSNVHLAPGPHLVTVVHEELAEAGPVHHVRVEVRRLKNRNWNQETKGRACG